MTRKPFCTLPVLFITSLSMFFTGTAELAEGMTVLCNKTQLQLPENDPVFTVDYDYPRIDGDDPCAALINDSFDTLREEVEDLLIPMLANTDATNDNRTMTQTYDIPCNNGRYLSFWFKQTTITKTGEYLSMESFTFDIGGDYNGQSLTLRGVVMVGESTYQIAESLKPQLYQQFVLLQEQGVIRPDLTEEDFYEIVSPESDFFTNEDNSVTFYFQPSLMVTPSFDVPCFTYTAEQLNSLLSTE